MNQEIESLIMWSAYPKGLHAARHKLSEINLDTIKKHFLK